MNTHFSFAIDFEILYVLLFSPPFSIFFLPLVTSHLTSDFFCVCVFYFLRCGLIQLSLRSTVFGDLT